MTQFIELVLLLIAPAIGGAMSLHLWQSRTHRNTRTGYSVGDTPMTIRKRPMASRRVWLP